MQLTITPSCREVLNLITHTGVLGPAPTSSQRWLLDFQEFYKPGVQLLYLETSHGGSVYASEIGVCYKSGLFVLFAFCFLKNEFIPHVRCLSHSVVSGDYLSPFAEDKSPHHLTEGPFTGDISPRWRALLFCQYGHRPAPLSLLSSRSLETLAWLRLLPPPPRPW